MFIKNHYDNFELQRPDSTADYFGGINCQKYNPCKNEREIYKFMIFSNFFYMFLNPNIFFPI